MSEIKNSQRILEIMADNEKNIESLYRKFAVQSPDTADQEFWNGFAGDESTHAEIIATLQMIAAQDKLSLDDNFFPVEVLEKINERLETLGDESVNWDTQLDMLREAVSLEESMVEKQLFESFRTEDEEALSLIDKLKFESADHYTRLSAKLKAVEASAF
jgi:hypothetical protein